MHEYCVIKWLFCMFINYNHCQLLDALILNNVSALTKTIYSIIHLIIFCLRSLQIIWSSRSPAFRNMQAWRYAKKYRVCVCILRPCRIRSVVLLIEHAEIILTRCNTNSWCLSTKNVTCELDKCSFSETLFFLKVKFINYITLGTLFVNQGTSWITFLLQVICVQFLH